MAIAYADIVLVNRSTVLQDHEIEAVMISTGIGNVGMVENEQAPHALPASCFCHARGRAGRIRKL
jgi:hypothetical protein